MKLVTPELATHLTQETTTLCHLLKIKRLDGVEVFLTDFDQNLTTTENLMGVAATWTPMSTPVEPWWVTTGDSIASLFGYPGHGFVPSVSATLGYTGRDYSLWLNMFGTAYWKGTTQFTKGITFETTVTMSGSSNCMLNIGMGNGALFTGTDTYAGFKTSGGSSFGGSGNWVCASAENYIYAGTTVSYDTGIPAVGGGVFDLKVVINLAGTEIKWFINSTQVYQTTTLTAIPTSPIPITMFAESYGGTTYTIGPMSVIAETLVTSIHKSHDGLTVSAVEHKDDGSPNNMQVTGFVDDAGVNEADVRARLYDGATFELRAVNWADITMGDLKLLSGTVGDITMKNGQLEMELRGLTQKLITQVGSVYSQSCMAELFGGGTENIDPGNHWKCRLNRADWVQTGTIGSSPDSVTLVPSGTLHMVGSATPSTAAPADWFNDGVIIFTSGVLNGYKFEIATWDATTLHLFAGSPMPQSPAPGDAFEIEVGCDKLRSTCHGKFNNAVNFSGFADIPGLNVLSVNGRPAIVNR